MTKVAVSYEGFKPEIAEDYPTFVKELLQILPQGAEFAPYVDEDADEDDEPYYWVVSQNGNEMFVLYDDEGLVEYDEDSEWGVTANLVLDFMDKIALQLYDYPSRLTD